jgi:hypothetical protein
VQSESEVPAGRPGGDPPERDSEVTVLAAPAGAQAGMRLGARIFPLERWMARRRAVVGAEVAVTASLLDQLPTSPAIVVVVAPGVAPQSVVDQLWPPVRGMLDLDGRDDRAVTVGVACPAPVAPGSAGGLSMYNQHAGALPEALVEAIAAGRRCGLTTPNGNCVLLLQRFVPPTASGVVRVSPDRAVPVLIDGRWGLTEDQSAADSFEVPADGTVRRSLAWKPTASLSAGGGTHTVPLPASWRNRYSINRSTVRQLAAMSRNAAVAVGNSLSLDVALEGRGPVVLRCRPSTG